MFYCYGCCTGLITFSSERLDIDFVVLAIDVDKDQLENRVMPYLSKTAVGTIIYEKASNLFFSGDKEAAIESLNQLSKNLLPR